MSGDRISIALIKWILKKRAGEVNRWSYRSWKQTAMDNSYSNRLFIVIVDTGSPGQTQQLHCF